MRYGPGRTGNNAVTVGATNGGNDFKPITDLDLGFVARHHVETTHRGSSSNEQHRHFVSSGNSCCAR